MVSLFVPSTMCPQVNHWAHTLLFSMYIITQRFWWPAMEKEVKEYSESCTICTRNKNSSQANMGLL